MSDYQINDIYQGGYSSLKPDYGELFSGYRIPLGDIGAPTSIQSANILKEMNQRISEGVIPIELQPLQPELFDQIPKQYFKEAKRMAKLTGTKISVHAPMIEPSGIDPEQRRQWEETYRELAEKQLQEVVKRSMELSDTESVPIVIHASGIPGAEFKMTKDGVKMDKMVAIDQESGKMIPLEEERMYYPRMIDVKKEYAEKIAKGELTETEIQKRIEQGKVKREDVIRKIPVSEGQIYTPENRLRSLNATQWDNSLSQLIFNKERADEILQNNFPIIQDLYAKYGQNGELKIDEKILEHDPIAKRALGHMQNAESYIDDINQHVRALFHKAYKYGGEEHRKKLIGWSGEFQEDLKKNATIMGQSGALHGLMEKLRSIVPETYVPIDKFALDKSAKTFANVAFNAYEEAKKQNKKAPTIAIENFFPGTSFAMSEKGKIPGIDNLILESRKKFVEKAKSKGISESVAKKQAEKMIGMTLDVGHINIAKKKGFEDKDIQKEVEQIAKYVKHVHLTDNFGYSDSHLPPGMGNVPLKEILKELEKAGTLKDTRKIVEAGAFVQQFGVSPLTYALEALGSPIYADGVGPYWNQATGLYQGYFGGMGMMLPQGNYQTFGAGFSQLPVELGGQMPNAQGSRMSGKGME